LGMPVEELPKTWWGELSPHLALIAFSALIFCGWNKFYAWYEKPLTEEWGWEDEKDDEDEKKIKKQADTEKKTLVEETPVPKTRWEKVKNWPQNNKVKTLALIMIIVNLVFLLVKMRKFNV
jgi:hypothetical protein